MSVAAATGALPGQSFALLSWGRETLALPQEAIHSLEAAADIEAGTAATGDNCFGYFRKEQCFWPAYIPEWRQDLDGVAEDYRLVVLLKNGTDGYGLFCSDFKLLDSGRVRLYAVPACMDGPNVLLSALLAYDGEVHGVANIAALLRLLRRQAR